MLKKKYIILLSLYFCVTIAPVIAQMGNNWCFGWHGGLNFNTSPPRVFSSSIHANDVAKTGATNYASTISDCQGNLWFYGTGHLIWNRYNTIMPNGNLDTLVNSTKSATCLSLIIPKPQTDSEFYYIFNPEKHYYYTIVDMRKDSGRGDVPQTPLSLMDSDTYYTNGIYIKHANDTDYWLVTKPNGNQCKVFLVTKDSINRKPIISNVYTSQSTTSNPNLYMRATRDGEQIIMPYRDKGSSMLELYDFDKKTGKISNPKELVRRSGVTNVDYITSPELSANDSLIYFIMKTEKGCINGCTFILCQEQRFKVYPFNSIQYLDTFYAGGLNGQNENIYGAKLGPDNKIYLGNKNYILLYINYPDKLGKSCALQKNGIDMSPAKIGSSMPCMDFPIKRINNKFDVTGANNCGYDSVRFNADADSGFRSYNWYFGDGDSAVGKSVVHQYKNAGSYYVTLGCELGNCGYKQWVGDSITIKFKPNIAIVDSTYYTCEQYHVQTKVLYKYCDTINLHLGNYDTILYTNNSGTVSTFIYNNIFDTNGTYTYYASAKNRDCYDSVVGLPHSVKIDPSVKPYFNTNYTQSCGNSTITLTDSSGMDSIIQQRKWTIYYPNNIVKQYDTVSTNKLKLIVQDTGYYNAKLIYITRQGCTDSLTLTNIFRILPQPIVVVDSPSHNPLCFGDSFILTAKQKDINYPPLVKYKWNMGQISTPSIKVDTANSYYVSAWNAYGCGAQSNTVKISFLPQLFANMKTSKDSLYIIATRPLVSYTWYKDSVLYNTSSSLLHPPTGRYYVHVVDGNGCMANSGSLLHTGMNNIEDIGGFIHVYPNPTNDVLYVELAASAPLSYRGQIVLYDMVGKRVRVLVGDNTNQRQVHVGDLPKGLYILSVGEEKIKIAVE